jgi:hypothetical protein
MLPGLKAEASKSRHTLPPLGASSCRRVVAFAWEALRPMPWPEGCCARRLCRHCLRGRNGHIGMLLGLSDSPYQ